MGLKRYRSTQAILTATLLGLGNGDIQEERVGALPRLEAVVDELALGQVCQGYNKS